MICYFLIDIGYVWKKNKASREKQVIKHTSRSNAQIRHEQVENLLLIRFACTSIVHKKTT